MEKLNLERTMIINSLEITKISHSQSENFTQIIAFKSQSKALKSDRSVEHFLIRKNILVKKRIAELKCT